MMRTLLKRLGLLATGLLLAVVPHGGDMAVTGAFSPEEIEQMGRILAPFVKADACSALKISTLCRRRGHETQMSSETKVDSETPHVVSYVIHGLLGSQAPHSSWLEDWKSISNFQELKSSTTAQG
jgi:hypothetical protein